MSPRRLLALAVLILASTSCTDLGGRPVVTFESESFDLDDLRRCYADLPAAGRPALATRPERLAFVDSVVRRRLLAAHGASLPADSAMAESVQRDREDVFLRRLHAVEGGMGDWERHEVEAAASRLDLALRVRRFLFRDPADAARAFERLASGSPGESLEADSTCRALSPEELTWIPWPLDPVVEAVAVLEPGQVSKPLEVDGWTQLVRLLDRVPRGASEPRAAGALLEEAVRRRKRALAVDALDRRLREAANASFDAEALRLVAERTRDALVESGFAENEPGFAIPHFSTGETARAIVRFRGGARQDSISIEDYLRALRRQIAGRRPARGPIEGSVRRFADQELGRRLFLAEAERRRLETDWWAARELARQEEERLVRRAARDIERSASPSSGTVDSLVTAFAAAEPGFLRQPPLARLLRADFPNEEAARAEMARIARAGGMESRYAELLDGADMTRGTYSFLRLVPGGAGSPAIEAAVFGRPPGGVLGPFPFGSSWMLLECLSIEPGKERSLDDARRQLRETIRDGNRAAAGEAWVRAKRGEARVVVDEDLLDGLAPGS